MKRKTGAARLLLIPAAAALCFALLTRPAREERQLPGLPPALDGLRLALLSSPRFPKRTERQLRRRQPDLIALTAAFRAEMPRAQTLLRALRGTAPILCAAPEEERAACAARCGALLLRGEGTELSWNGLRLRLFGKDGDCALAPAQGGGPTIVLSPDGPSLAGFVSWTLHSEGASRIE